MCETCACVVHTNLYTLSTLVLPSYSTTCLRGVHVLREALVCMSATIQKKHVNHMKLDGQWPRMSVTHSDFMS